MNEVLKCIKERRTTRKFKQEQIKEEDLTAIIDAGLYAPSGMNMQSWHFTVIQNRDLIDEMNLEIKESFKQSDDEAMKKAGFNENYIPTYDAPTVILVSGLNDNLFTEVDCAAATQNMLLGAHSLKIASCWCAAPSMVFQGEKKEEFRTRLNIPDNYTPSHAVLLGYSDNTPTKASKRQEHTVQYVR